MDKENNEDIEIKIQTLENIFCFCIKPYNTVLELKEKISQVNK